MAKHGPFRIEVKLRNDGIVQIVTCTKASLTIGSGASNDLILTGPLVQPQHLRIDFYGRQTRIVYVNSNSDHRRRSHMDRNQPPKVETWHRGESVEVGDYILTLLAMTPHPADLRVWQLPEDRWGIKKYLRVISSPTGSQRVWWLLLMIIGGSFFVGSCSLLGFSYIQPILPKPIVLPLIASRMEPIPTIITASRKTTQVAMVTSVIAATSMPTLQYVTPTRIPIRLESDGASDFLESNVIPSLVDGPQLSPFEPLTVLVTVTPTAEPTPIPTATTAPVEIIELSEPLQQLGIWIEPAIVPIGQQYWRLAEVRWLNEEESLGRNYIFIEVVDNTGVRVMGQGVNIAWKDDQVTLLTNKPVPDVYALDFLMNASGNAYSVWLTGMPSDTIHGLGMGTVEGPLAYTRTAFWLKFQQVPREP